MMRHLQSARRLESMRWTIGVITLLGFVLFVAAIRASSALPTALLGQIPEDRRAEVEGILADPTFVRGLDLHALADVQVYAFLLDHPDVNAGLAQALDIAPYEVVRTGPGRYRGDDGNGNAGTIEIFGTAEQRVVMERGVSPGWWFGDIQGRVIALVGFSPTGEDLRASVKIWARIDHGLLDRLIRVVRPVLGGFLDRKLREQFGIGLRVAAAARQAPGEFCPALASLPTGSPDEKQALAGLAQCRMDVAGRPQPDFGPAPMVNASAAVAR